MRNLLIVLLCALVVILAVFVYKTRKPDTGYVLTGKEILLEIECPNEPAESGIYTLDPFKDKEPRLWMVGAHRPVWSRDRTVLAYEYNDFIYIMKTNEIKSIIVASLNYTSRNYNYPLLIMNENQGVIYQQTVSPEIKRDMVCGWWEIEKLKPLKQGTDIRDMRSFWLFRPLPEFTRFSPDDHLHEYNKAKVGRSVSFAPGEQQAAVAESLLSPFGSQNNYSKIMIYNIGMPGYVYKEGILVAGDINDKQLKDRRPLGVIPPKVFSGENCRRLTQLPDSTVEMDPIWSPDGKWIAFTAYDPIKRRSDVVVCKPDGADLINLTKYVSSSAPYSPFGLNWLHVKDLNSEITGSIEYSNLGINDARLLEWSQDSKYLLFVRGNDIEAYSVARMNMGQWDIARWVRGHGLHTGYKSSYRRVCFGYRDSASIWIVYFEQSDNGSQNIVVSDLAGKRSNKSYFVDQKMRVLWMDW